MTVADRIVEYLEQLGIDYVFELSGGMITPLLDAVDRAGTVQLVDCRHEQGAGFAAEGWARVVGKPGVAFATSGPGATNLLTAIGSCYFDSTPAVFITGNVPTHEAKPASSKARQRGFQELDIAAMAAPVTKFSRRVTTPAEALTAVAEGFRVAMENRRGPVLIDIPLDVLWAKTELVMQDPAAPPEELPQYVVDEAQRAITVLDAAKRPLVLVGGGCSGKPGVAKALAWLGYPRVHSLLGADVLASQTYGFIGTYGNRWANKALAACDALLVLGSRFDLRQTGSKLDIFTGKKIIAVLDDEAELDLMARRGLLTRGVQADVGAFCEALQKIPVGDPARKCKNDSAWWHTIADWAAESPDTDEHPEPHIGLNPNRAMHILGHYGKHVAVYTVDVGAHQMWAAQSLPLQPGQRFLTSGGMGSMGFALPAAIGAALGKPGRVVCAIAGDGGFQINVQELQTIAERQLPIKMVVFNNAGHGMVRQFQRERFAGRLAGTGPRPPDFVRISEAYGIPAMRCENPDYVEDCVRNLFTPLGPGLLVLGVHPSRGVWPKAKFGHGLDEMDP